MGRLYHYEEFLMVNMTIASMTLSMGILSDGVLPYALEQAIRGIQAFAPSAAPMIDAILEHRKDFDYAGAMASIEDLKKRVTEIELVGDKAELLQEELEILHVHPRLWIERNKIHGMVESTASIAKIVAQLQA